MSEVIVVPETDDFTYPVSHECIVWINANLGTPNLSGRGVRYLAPYWITEDLRGVNRLYHILDLRKDDKGVTTIVLGNSFVTPKLWDSMGQTRKFEYHSLNEFGMEEIEPGLLKQSK